MNARSPISRRNIIALGATAAIAPAFIPRRSFAQTTKIRVSTLVADTFAETFYAQEQGFFAKAGLDVEIVPLANATIIAAAIAGGSVDIGNSDTVSVANAVSRGVPVRMIAGGSLYDTKVPAAIVAVAKSSSISKPKDFEGQIIALPSLVGMSTAAVREWLETSGADPAKVRFVELTSAQMAPALAADRIQGAMLGEPFLAMASADVRSVGKPYDRISSHYMLSQFAANPEWIAQNRAAVARFVGVIYDTARWANAHHDQSLEILAKVARMDPDRLRSMNRVPYATSLDAGLIQPVLDYAAKWKVIDRQMRVDQLVYKI